MNDRVRELEAMGYFGDLNEGIWQRLANGGNSVLATLGSSRAAGKLNVGQLVVGLEKEYKTWLGANGIGSPTRRDFSNFLGFLEQKYNIKFGDNGETTEVGPPPNDGTASSPAPAQQTPSQPATTQQPRQPEQQQNNADISALEAHPVLGNTFEDLENGAKENEPARRIQAKVDQIVTISSQMNKKRAALSKLANIARTYPQSAIGQAIKIAIEKYGLAESRKLNQLALFEAAADQDDEEEGEEEGDPNSPDAPFSMSQARAVFKVIARHDFNNVGNGGPNPARSNRGGGGNTQQGGNQGGSQQTNRGGNPAATQAVQAVGDDESDQEHDHDHDALESGGSAREMIPMDFLAIRTELQTCGVTQSDIGKLNEFISSSMHDSAMNAGRALERAGVFTTHDKAYQTLVVVLRQINKARGGAGG